MKLVKMEKGLTVESLADPTTIYLKKFQDTQTLMSKYCRSELLIVEKVMGKPHINSDKGMVKSSVWWISNV